jgi:drug/metabolite transporter (DMT)-like permease
MSAPAAVLPGTRQTVWYFVLLALAFGVLLAALLLGERLNPVALIGAAIVLISTILVVRYDTSY